MHNLPNYLNVNIIYDIQLSPNNIFLSGFISFIKHTQCKADSEFTDYRTELLRSELFFLNAMVYILVSS